MYGLDDKYENEIKKIPEIRFHLLENWKEKEKKTRGKKK